MVLERAIESSDLINHLAKTADDLKIDRLDTPPVDFEFIDALQAEFDTVVAAGAAGVATGTVTITTSHADFTTAIEAFLEAYYGDLAPNPRPRSFGAFIDAWRDSAFNFDPPDDRTLRPDADKGIDGSSSGAVYDASPWVKANKDFRQFTGAGDNDLVGSATALGGWEALDGADFLVGATVEDQLQSAFLAAFAGFARYGRFPQGSSTNVVAQTLAGLEETWNAWMQRTTETDAAAATGPSANLQTYERIWQGYFGDTTGFVENMLAFANEKYAEEGYFLPTHFVEKWVDTVKDAAARRGTLPFNTTIGSTQRVNQAIILNEVFDLLVDMIGVIQKVTSALASRLQFLADYQNQMTKLMDQMPVFTTGGPSEALKTEDTGEDADPDETGTRSDGNAANQAALENLRAHRDIAGDETKALQTTVNQLNDAASQQANIATAILQQLSGILTLIFR